MDGPYREPPVPQPQTAPSRDGAVQVGGGVDRVEVALGERCRLIVSGSGAAWIRRRRRGTGERRRVLPLGRERIFVARAHPTRDLAIWYEAEPGHVERLGGARPVPLLDEGALGAWRALDRAAADLGRRLAAWAGGAEEATELGKGGHRVLLVRFADRLVVYARPVFRERPRRVLEVCWDGSIVIPTRGGDRRAAFQSRSGVSLIGDRIQFETESGERVAALWLPWISPEDRQELARRFGDLVDPSPPVPDSPPRRAPMRPWASGLGRTPPLAGLLPAPLPRSITARLRR